MWRYAHIAYPARNEPTLTGTIWVDFDNLGLAAFNINPFFFRKKKPKSVSYIPNIRTRLKDNCQQEQHIRPSDARMFIAVFPLLYVVCQEVSEMHSSIIIQCYLSLCSSITFPHTLCSLPSTPFPFHYWMPFSRSTPCGFELMTA